VQAHHTSFLAGCYPSINGGIDEQVRKNQKFFSSHNVTPRDNRVAIDLGAGYRVPVNPACSAGVFGNRGGLLPAATGRTSHVCRSIANRYHPEQYPALFLVGRPAPAAHCLHKRHTHPPASPGRCTRPNPECFSDLDPGGRLVLTLRDYFRERDKGGGRDPGAAGRGPDFSLLTGLPHRYTHRAGHTLLPREGGMGEDSREVYKNPYRS
jgi:hypothetical protein